MSTRLLSIIFCLIVLLGLLPPVLDMKRSYQTRKMIEQELVSPHWTQRYERIKGDTVRANSIIFLGNSLTELSDLRIYNNPNLLNHGISGDYTAGVLKRLALSVKGNPQKIFIEIGINDLIERVPQDVMLSHYAEIIQRIRKASPDTKLYAISLTPSALPDGLLRTSMGINSETRQFNEKLYRLCLEQQVKFIDMYTPLQENGRLKEAYSTDGIHLTEAAYAVWKNNIEPYINE